MTEPFRGVLTLLKCLWSVQAPKFCKCPRFAGDFCGGVRIAVRTTIFLSTSAAKIVGKDIAPTSRILIVYSLPGCGLRQPSRLEAGERWFGNQKNCLDSQEKVCRRINSHYLSIDDVYHSVDAWGPWDTTPPCCGEISIASKPQRTLKNKILEWPQYGWRSQMEQTWPLQATWTQLDHFGPIRPC